MQELQQQALPSHLPREVDLQLEFLEKLVLPKLRKEYSLTSGLAK